MMAANWGHADGQDVNGKCTNGESLLIYYIQLYSAKHFQAQGISKL